MRPIAASRIALHRAWQHARQRPGRAALAVVGAAALLFVLVLVQLVAHNAAAVSRSWTGGAHMVVYLDDDVPASHAAAIKKALAGLPGVVSAEHIGAAESLARLREAMGEHDRDLLAGMEAGMIPASIEVVFSAGLSDVAAIHPVIQRLEATPGVAQVELAGEWVTRAAALARALRYAAWGLIVLIAIACTLAMATITALLQRDRDRQADVLSLVGASRGFLRSPVLIEGTLQGATGALVALGVALLVYRTIAGSAQSLLDKTFDGARVSFLPGSHTWAVIAAGAAIGLAGSWLATRRHGLA